MELSNKNKKILEDLFERKISYYGRNTYGDETYTIQPSNISGFITLTYNPDNESYRIHARSISFICRLKECDEIVVVYIGTYYIEFKFIDDLKNIDI